MNYELLRNADIKLKPTFDDRGRVQAQINVNDKYEHTFTSNSRISKALAYTDESTALKLATQQMQDRLNGGDYFFVDDQLIDFRDDEYNGFVHTDEGIDNMMKHIGVLSHEANTRAGLRLNTTEGNVILANRFSQSDFQVASIGSGGLFQSNILFSWNPFTSFVRGSFEIVRLMCTNGMVGTSDVINNRIPVINRWAEHLEIASKQMAWSVEGIVSKRLAEMTTTRANVNDLALMSKHALSRVADSKTRIETDRLKQISHIADPMIHLRDYYTDDQLKMTALSSQLPGHLTQFDLLNAVTEVLTHTNENEQSTAGSLQIFANRLLFPSHESGRPVNRAPITSAFSDPDKAFFGA